MQIPKYMRERFTQGATYNAHLITFLLLALPSLGLLLPQTQTPENEKNPDLSKEHLEINVPSHVPNEKRHPGRAIRHRVCWALTLPITGSLPAKPASGSDGELSLSWQSSSLLGDETVVSPKGTVTPGGPWGKWV